MDAVESIFQGGMLGSALGDAVGECAFQYSGEESLWRHVEETGLLSYTDDTAMALGLAECLLQQGDIDQQELGRIFRVNYEREPWRGYGPGPPAVFSRVMKSGISYRAAARMLFGGKGSLGNGAAMRIVALGLFYRHSGLLYEKARLSAEVTHSHPVGIDGAALQAIAVARAALLDPENEFPVPAFADGLIHAARTDIFKEKMTMVKDLLAEGALPDEAARVLGKSVAVHESMPFAVFSFLKNHQSFRETVACAVLHGGDRDTLGAMAGALSGAYLGVGAIPPDWRDKLENGNDVATLASRLAAAGHPRD